MTTTIDSILGCEEKEMDYDNELEKILDMNLSSIERIQIINIYSDKDVIEIINKINGMYMITGTSLLKKFIQDICKLSKIEPTLKVECCKCLCMKSKDDLNFQTLHNVLDYHYHDIPLPCKIIAIVYLTYSEDFEEKALEHFKVILNDSFVECEFRYKMILSLDRVYSLDKDKFIFPLLWFFTNLKSPFATYKILSCQNLLQNYPEKVYDYDYHHYILGTLYGFATDLQLDYNIRADATDVLLGLGNDEYKELARQIMNVLGNRKFTIYDDQQNVHKINLDKDILPILDTIVSKPHSSHVNFDFVKNKLNMLLELSDDDKKSLNIAMNRIEMDTSLYSQLNITLSTILQKVYNYSINHVSEFDMQKRIIEELVDASGKCSTGYGNRLINALSGFDDMFITISDEESIVGKVSGRLNKLIRGIKDDDEREEVMYQMTLSMDKDYLNKQKFLEFLRNNIMTIKNDIWGDVREYLDPNRFELYFRKAIALYEGIKEFK